MLKSEIAHIRSQIQSEYDASQQGLSGFATGTARHDFIAARTAQIGMLHEQLANLIGPEQAIEMIANTIWTPTDQGAASLAYAQTP